MFIIFYALIVAVSKIFVNTLYIHIYIAYIYIPTTSYYS